MISIQLWVHSEKAVTWSMIRNQTSIRTWHVMWLSCHVTELSCDCSKQKVVIESDSLSPPPQFYTKTQCLFSRVWNWPRFKLNLNLQTSKIFPDKLGCLMTGFPFKKKFVIKCNIIKTSIKRTVQGLDMTISRRKRRCLLPFLLVCPDRPLFQDSQRFQEDQFPRGNLFHPVDRIRVRVSQLTCCPQRGSREQQSRSWLWPRGTQVPGITKGHFTLSREEPAFLSFSSWTRPWSQSSHLGGLRCVRHKGPQSSLQLGSNLHALVSRSSETWCHLKQQKLKSLFQAKSQNHENQPDLSWNW